MVTSDVGQACGRESDCGPGQTCVPTEVDADGNGTPELIAATCQLNNDGASSEGGRCLDDSDCIAGGCALGRCTTLCRDDDDCRAGQACAGVPRELGGERDSLVSACVPGAGVVAVELEVSADGDVRVPVPTHARSFTLVVEGPQDDAIVAVDALQAPSGEMLYQRPETPDDLWDQPLRYLPATGVSSLMVPSSSAAKLELGVYHGRVRTQALGAATPPRARVIYRLGSDGRLLDVNLHFVELEGHPCPGADVSAAAASDSHGEFAQQFLATWRGVLAPAGIGLGEVLIDEIQGRPELAQLDTADDLRALFRLSRPGPPALDVFVVRSIYPLGVSAIVGGTPGPFAAGGPHSGIVLSADAVCAQGWSGVGRLAARASLRYLGLWESVDLEGHLDPLDSTDTSSKNLLYYRADGTELTEEQATVVRRNPLLR